MWAAISKPGNYIYVLHIHICIQLDNIVLYKNGTAKIIDFGEAHRVCDENRSQAFCENNSVWKTAGSKFPGRLPKLTNDMEVEIWRLGYLLHVMIHGSPLLNPCICNMAKLLFKVARNEPTFPEDFCCPCEHPYARPNFITVDCCALLEKLLLTPDAK